MAERRVLTTGATGFIGSYLVEELRRTGWQVVVLTEGDVTADGDPGITILNVDLNDAAEFARTLARVVDVDAILHLGARLPKRGGSLHVAPFIRANTLVSARLLDHFLQSNARVLVYASSVSVIGIPQQVPISEEHPIKHTNPYSFSKWMTETMVRTFADAAERRAVSLRLASVYGPGMVETTALPRFVRTALAGDDVTVFGTGTRCQTFVHVRDVCEAFTLALESGTGVYNVGGPSHVTMADLADMVLERVPNTSSRAVYVDHPDAQEGQRWEVDSSKAMNELGYHPSIELGDGVTELVEFLDAGEPRKTWWRRS